MLGNCLTLSNAVTGTSNLAGTGFIFRGGDTWHFGNSGSSPYTGGMWNLNGLNATGTAANPVYIGVDKTWFSGGAWTRPILTGDNPRSTSAVSSCAYQIGSQNWFFNNGFIGYYVIDNFELTGQCVQDLNNSLNDTAISYGDANGADWFYNLYMHGWTHKPFGNPSSPVTCTPTTVCDGVVMFQGTSASPSYGDHLRYVVIDGSDSDNIGATISYGGCFDWAYNYFGNISSQICREMHSWHDNLLEYHNDNGHANILESIPDWPGTNAIYNNLFRHIGLNGLNTVGLWPSPQHGDNTFIFNNLYYDQEASGTQNNNTGNTILESNGTGFYTEFNNTWEDNVGNRISSCDPNSQGIVFSNNFYITNGSAYAGGSFFCVGQPSTTLITDGVGGASMSNSSATRNGYTSSQTYPYSPTLSGSPTVRVGTNRSSYCTTLSSSLDALIQAAGAACQKDTTLAIVYNSGSHTVSWPARIPNARPLTGPWDLGAYNFSGSPPPPNPPTQLRIGLVGP